MLQQNKREKTEIGEDKNSWKTEDQTHSERLPLYDLETHCCSLVAKLRLAHSRPHGLGHQAPLSISTGSLPLTSSSNHYHICGQVLTLGSYLNQNLSHYKDIIDLDSNEVHIRWEYFNWYVTILNIFDYYIYLYVCSSSQF